MSYKVADTVARSILVRAGLIPGDDKDLRVGALWGPGGQSGAFGGGCAIGLTECGLIHGWDVDVGVSAGILNAAFKQSGQAVIGTTIYHEDNTKGFINPFRLQRIIDIDHLEHTVRHVKVLDIEALKRNPTPLFAAVTDLNGEGRLVNVKLAVDPVMPIMGSCALPILDNRPRLLEDVKGLPVIYKHFLRGQGWNNTSSY